MNDDAPHRDTGGIVPSPAKAVANARLLYGALLVVTVALGLATRRYPAFVPTVVSLYGGDTLWAMMIVWIVALLRPRMRTLPLAAAALGICVLVETSQLYQAQWINAIRATRIGALALGFGFLWSDMVCYVVGVTLAAVIRECSWRH